MTPEQADGDAALREVKHRLFDVATNLHVENFVEEGNITIDTYVTDPEICATANLSGEWGSAGVALTPEKARTLAYDLRSAADEWEGDDA